MTFLFFTFEQYGHFFPDPQYENVQHIICCDSFATYAYDFEFSSNDGLSRYNASDCSGHANMALHQFNCEVVGLNLYLISDV